MRGIGMGSSLVGALIAIVMVIILIWIAMWIAVVALGGYVVVSVGAAATNREPDARFVATLRDWAHPETLGAAALAACVGLAVLLSRDDIPSGLTVFAAAATAASVLVYFRAKPREDIETWAIYAAMGLSGLSLVIALVDGASS